MIVVDRNRQPEADELDDRPPATLPWHRLTDVAVLVAATIAGALSYPIRRLRGRAQAEASPVPSEEEVFNARLADLTAQNLTMGYLLQSSVARMDMMLHPQPRVAPLEAPRTTIAASLRVKRKRHTGPSSIKSHRGVMFAGLVMLVAPAVVMAGMYGLMKAYEHYSSGYAPPTEVANLGEPIRGARILDRNGVLLYEFIDEKAGVRFPVGLDDISPNMLVATIATEDQSYYSNPGVNPRGILRAAWENFSPYLKNEADEVLEGSGGSSITQQLVKNIFIAPELRTERSWQRKITEAALALELTYRNDKDQILEWYLNEISYGGIYNGIEAAAQGYFGVPASRLTLAQAATLAGIPQSPALYDPVNRPEAALARRNEVLDLIAKHATIRIGESTYYTPSLEVIETAKLEPLGVQRRTFEIDAPHFVLNHVAPEVIALLGPSGLYRDGLIVTTSLDLGLQHETQGLLERWITEFEAVSNSHNGAVLVLDNRTGEVLVLIGSRDYYDETIDGNVDNLTALNSPGSSFKPFVFLTSFMKLGWTPSTTIADTPVTYREVDGTVFQPQNPVKNSYLGNIPVKTALGNSLNVPPFKAVLQMGVDSVVEVGKQAGFTTMDRQYGPAIALGGVDLTALDLTYGYSVLANNGVMVGVPTTQPYDPSERALDPVMILKIEDRAGNVLWSAEDERRRQQVIPAEHAYLVTSILTDGQNTCVTFGCGGVTVPGHTVGVKTGTSEPFDPNGPDAGKIGETWAFGYTPEYVVGVWAGNSNNEPIVNIYSTSISFRVMRDTLLAVYKGSPSTAFIRPAGIDERRTCTGSGAANRCTTDLYVRSVTRVDETPLMASGELAAVPTAVLAAAPVTDTSAALAQVEPTQAAQTPAATSTVPAAVAPPTATPPPLPTQAPPSPTPTAAEARATPADATQQPLAMLLPPAAGGGSVNLEGWAWSQEMSSYRIEYSPANAANWRVIGQSSSPVRGGTLGVWRTSGLAPGSYHLRVVVVDASGEYVSSPIIVTLGG